MNLLAVILVALSSPLLVSTGKIVAVYPSPSGKGNEGFLCHVRFERDGCDMTIGVAVATLDRVKGGPQNGATIRVEHRGPELDDIFEGARALSLESMVFTDNGEQDVKSDGEKPLD